MSFLSKTRATIYRNPGDLPPVMRYAVRSVQFFLSSWTEFTRHHGPIRASGLAYSTLLALVPLVVVVFSFFSAFGGFEAIRSQLQSALVSILIPTRQEEILKYIGQFLENAETLGLIGFLSFAVTSVFLLANIERNFNEIWGTASEVRFTRRLTIYTSVLVLGTLLIAASFLLTTWIFSFLNELGIRQVTVATRLLIRLFPTILMLGALVLMIMQVPSSKVQFSSALIGGSVGAVLWEAAKFLFNTWANSSVRNSVVYGSLALIPIFLIWLYVAWNIILFALSVSYVHQHIQRSTTDNYVPLCCPADRLLLGIGLFLYIADRFQHGKDSPDISDLSNEFLVSPSEIDAMLKLFKDNRLVLPVEGQKACYVPARSLDTITVREIAGLILGEVSDSLRSRFSGVRNAAGIVSSFTGSAFATVEGLTVYDIVSADNVDEDTGGCVESGENSD